MYTPYMYIIYRRFKVEFNINSHAYTSTQLYIHRYCILLYIIIITFGACVKKNFFYRTRPYALC